MLTLLKSAKDGKHYKLNDIVELLAVDFKLAEEERKELLPNGQLYYLVIVLDGLEHIKKSRMISPKRDLSL